MLIVLLVIAAVLEVQEIVKEVVAYGKQASAHISIYYAMYLYE